MSLPFRTRLATAAGAAIGATSRRLGRGSGSVIGGRAILGLDPAALTRLAAGRRLALVSGTNGKTTTTSLLTVALATHGPVVTNALGANLPPGITAALAAAPPATSRAVIEVDEAWLGRVAKAVDPDVIVLLNLSRDQLDRNNEVRRLSATWRSALAEQASASPGTHVVANADDPLVAWAALVAPEEDVTWVGAGQRWTADAAGCPSCGGRIHFAGAAGAADSAGAADFAGAAGGSGGWACSNCELRRPALDVWLEAPDVVTASGDRFTLDLRLPGQCNRANAAMAMSAARHLGVRPVDALAAMSATTEVAGRYRTVMVNDTAARLLLAKNPAGWMEVFDLLAPAPGPVVVAINARIADGKDPSWLWDVPFERLRGRLVVATGERSHDLAVRLHYAEVDHLDEPDARLALADAAAAATNGTVDVVANYTSFQTISSQLSRAA